MVGLLKTVKYFCAYSHMKNELYAAADFYVDRKNSLSERNDAALNMKKNAKHVVGLARLLRLFDDSDNEKSVERIKFADKLWGKLTKKYDSMGGIA